MAAWRKSKVAFEAATAAATWGLLIYLGAAIYQSRKESPAMAEAAGDRGAAWTPGAGTGVNPGEVAQILPEIKAKNLIIAVSEGCLYCRRSVDFYRTALASAAGKRPPPQVVFAFPRNSLDASIHSFLESLHAPGLTAVRADFGACGIRGTPTLILVDGSGRIVGQWVGLLNSHQQSQVLAAL